MGKVKEQMEYEERLEFYLELCYQEWCMDNLKQPREKKEHFLDLSMSDMYLYICSVNNAKYKSSSWGD